MRLTVQNMVCDRCVESVRQIFDEVGIPVHDVSLGRVDTVYQLDSELLIRVSDRLAGKGFGLIQEREKELIEQMKVHLLSYIDHLESDNRPVKLSIFVSSKMNYNYSYLSKLFSDHMNETVENYMIRLKIERVKELLEYRTFTLSEIAWRLNYSSVQYLSNQFKKITGTTVTGYLSQRESHRKALDRI